MEHSGEDLGITAGPSEARLRGAHSLQLSETAEGPCLVIDGVPRMQLLRYNRLHRHLSEGAEVFYDADGCYLRAGDSILIVSAL